MTRDQLQDISLRFNNFARKLPRFSQYLEYALADMEEGEPLSEMYHTNLLNRLKVLNKELSNVLTDMDLCDIESNRALEHARNEIRKELGGEVE